MTRVIAHVDLDQFFAAVEILDFPELKGKPVIVGGRPDSRGVVSTASYEARKFGVRSAMASATAARLCPQAIWRKPRMSRYAEKSREVFAVFQRFTDLIEPLSMDEAFLELTGSIQLFGPPETIGRRIKEEIRAASGLVGSVGIAENKFLAKVASDLKKPDGFVIVPPGQDAAEAMLGPLPVSRLWGVGPKMAERLNEYGFRTVAQLRAADPAWLGRRIGAPMAEHLLNLSRGIDSRPVECRGKPKSISRENTFAEDLRDRAAMERELLAFADNVATRLRAEGRRCHGVTLKIRLADLSRITRSSMFDDPVDVAEPLYDAAVKLLRERADFRGQAVRLLGISATHLVGPDERTESLFPDEKAERLRHAAEAVDRLRARFGDSAVTRGRLLEDRAKNTGTPSDHVRRKGETEE